MTIIASIPLLHSQGLHQLALSSNCFRLDEYTKFFGVWDSFWSQLRKAGDRAYWVHSNWRFRERERSTLVTCRALARTLPQLDSL